MDATNTISTSSTTPPCAYSTVSRWAKGDHVAHVSQAWSDLISGKCVDETITLADFDVLMSMVLRLECYFKEEDLRKVSFNSACSMYIFIVDELESELRGDNVQGTDPRTH
ncbi:hypothetical protein [Aestuariivirga sp.]|uniref:hypothetical protein n=1 Tax=Aestuariivirga sp. TaxID=2650926 RepID=UPI003919AEAB